MEKKVHFGEKQKKILMFCGIFLLSCLIIGVTEAFYSNEPFRHDAGDYWYRGECVSKGEPIDAFRGYAYPAYLAICHLLGGRMAWNVINALMLALFCSFIVPRLMNRESTPSKEEAIRVILFTMMLCVFFSGPVGYPLSDLIALVFACFAVFLTERAMQSGRGIFLRLLLLFFAGLAASIAYNIRTIYLFSLYTTVVILLVSSKQAEPFRKALKNLPLRLASYVLGAFLGAVPQGIMNLRVAGYWTLKVLNENLMLRQMLWGMKYQRYDTYSPPMFDAEHPNIRNIYADRFGQSLLKNAQIDEFESWGEFIGLFLSHPIDFIAMYVRHFVNYLLPCFPEVYVRELRATKWVMGIVGFTILFLAIMGLVTNLYKRYDGLISWIPILLPAFAIIPGAVEYRFSIAIYIFAFYQLCFNFDFQKLRELLIRKKSEVLVVYAVTLALVFVIWGNTLASEFMMPLLF